MEIRKTNDRDIPELKRLWRKVFDNEGIYTDLFFKHRYENCQGIGLFCADKVLSALYLLPCKFKVKDKEYTARYVFAVATFPCERGKGYSGKVMRYAHECMLAEGVDVSILMPAEKSLFDFYKKQGYQTAFYINMSKFKTEKDNIVKLEKCDLSSMFELREKHMNRSDGYLSWDKDALKFCQIDNDYSHGSVLSFSDISEGYAVCSYFEDCVVIKELVCEKDCKEKIINSIGNYFNKKKVILRDYSDEKAVSFGMLYPISEKFSKEFKTGSYYLSLPMD